MRRSFGEDIRALVNPLNTDGNNPSRPQQVGPVAISHRDLYGPPLGTESIRLLEILPTNSSTLAIRLQRVSLQNVPYFIALSHFWGSDQDLLCLKVKTHDFGVPRFVYQLLDSLRPERKLSEWLEGGTNLRPLASTLFWLDTICVNQRDTDEIAQQVSIMRKIYAAAAITYISLGRVPGCESTEQQLINWLYNLGGVSVPQLRVMPRETRLPRYWNRQQWAHLVKVLESPWFFRRWTVQEAVVTANPFVLYGGQLLPWERFSTAIANCRLLWDDDSVVNAYQRVSPNSAGSIELPLSISHLREAERRHLPKPGLLELLTRFRRNGCMRPLDRIFAFLGICDEQQAEFFSLEYGQSPEEVYMLSVLTHIARLKNLEFLSACLDAARIQRGAHAYPLHTGAPVYTGHGIGPMTINPDLRWPKAEMTYLPDLPSWVPNWTSGYAHWTLAAPTWDHTRSYAPLFRASGDIKFDEAVFDHLVDERILVVSGLELDMIPTGRINILWPVHGDDWNKPDANVWPSTFFTFCQTTGRQDVYQSGQERFDAFCRTIVAGGWDDLAGAFLSSRFIRHAARQWWDGTHFARQIDQMGLDLSLPSTEKEYYVDPPLPLRQTGIPPYASGLSLVTQLRFAATQLGRMALVPPQTRPNDRVCVIFGCSSPIILSPRPDRPDCYIVRGEAYVDGLMHGRAAEAFRLGEIEMKTFRLA